MLVFIATVAAVTWIVALAVALALCSVAAAADLLSQSALPPTSS